MAAELPRENWTVARLALGAVLAAVAPICVHRGQLEEARTLVEAASELETSADLQERCQHGLGKGQILFAEGDVEGALNVAESVFAERESMGIGHETIKESFGLAVQAALGLGRVDEAERLLSTVERLAPGGRPQFLNAHVARFRAHMAVRDESIDEADRLFKRAGGLFQELAMPFHLAVTRVEQAEWFAVVRRVEEAEPLIAEARDIFERLDARPWLERLSALNPDVRAEATPA